MTNQQEAEQIKPKSGGKKLLIVGLVAGLLLGGSGGVGAFIMMEGGERTQEAPKEEIVEKKPKKDPHFIKIERVTIPLAYKDRVLGYVVADFSLEVDGKDNKLKVFSHLPEIRDAILRHYSKTPVGKADNPRSIDYPKLKKTLREISNKILAKPLVQRVMVVQARYF